jgi:dimethylhistidine N-methyltransferase
MCPSSRSLQERESTPLPETAWGVMEMNSANQSQANVEQDVFLQDVLAGLSQQQKQLPCKYFYDERGSQLFEDICQLDEYYLTRTELTIMEDHADEMGQQIGPGAMLVEYGSGSSIKTRILLDNLPDPTAYVPVDISGDHLYQTAEELREDYPEIEILPVCADFNKKFSLPTAAKPPTHAAVYFPGSTIGNFRPAQARRLLRGIGQICGSGGGLLIGVDLQKDPRVIEAAYNDRHGVTGQFNLNLLHRINRELEADLNVDEFEHDAIYNRKAGRVEIYLVSKTDQTATIQGHDVHFQAGERIHTEDSHKYTIDGFAAMARESGLSLHRAWIDDDEYFAVLHFVVN